MLNSMFRVVASLAANWRRAGAVVTAWVVVGAVVVAAAPPLSSVTSNEQETFLPAGSESRRALDLLAEKFPDSQGAPAIVVLHRPQGLLARDLETAAQLAARLQADDAPPDVESVLALSTAPELAAALLAPDRTTLMTVVAIAGSPADESFSQTVAWVRAQAHHAAQGAGLTAAVTGPGGIVSDTLDVFRNIDVRVTLLTVALVLALLLLIYRSPVLALLPVVGVGWTLLVAQSVAAILASTAGLTFNLQVTSLMSVLMFGAGTDFTLFIVSRYREELGRQPTRWQAMQVTLQKVAPAIASSAGTTIAAMLALMLAAYGAFQTMGPALALAIALMLLSGLTLIPALTVALGPAAFWPGRMRVSGAPSSRLWSAVAGFVARRPMVTFAATAAVLLVFAAGAPTINPSFSFIDSFPDDAESKIGAQILDDSFGAGDVAPTNLYVLTDAVDQNLAALDGLSAAIAALPGVARVSGPTRPGGEPPAVSPAALQAAAPRLAAALGPAPPDPSLASIRIDPGAQALMQTYAAGRRFVSPDGTTARLDVVMADDPYGPPAIDRIGEIRAQARAAAAGTSLQSAELLVGGPTAVQTDSRNAVARDAAVVGPLVAALIWVILLVLLRSLVAATYLVASVLLSFLAALGLSVVIFQNILGHPGVGYQNAIWMFIFLSALGADYNILIMSRLREEIRARGLAEGTRRAVARTGGVITSAGLILAGTFSILATFPLRDIFQLGFAVMLGVLLDTFVVRALLVPSIVILLRRWNWWPARMEVGTVTADG